MMILELVDMCYGFANFDEVLATIAFILEGGIMGIFFFFTHHSPTLASDPNHLIF